MKKKVLVCFCLIVSAVMMLNLIGCSEKPIEKMGISFEGEVERFLVTFRDSVDESGFPTVEINSDYEQFDLAVESLKDFSDGLTLKKYNKIFPYNGLLPKFKIYFADGKIIEFALIPIGKNDVSGIRINDKSYIANKKSEHCWILLHKNMPKIIRMCMQDELILYKNKEAHISFLIF